MARLKVNINFILKNSVDDINSIPLIMDYKTSNGTEIPEIVMPTNDLCIALVTIADKVATNLKMDYQTAFTMVKNSVFSNNTSDSFEVSIQSLLILQVQYNDKSQKGTSMTVLNRLESDISAKIMLIAKQVYQKKITSVLNPFQSILIRFPNTGTSTHSSSSGQGDSFHLTASTPARSPIPSLQISTIISPIKKVRRDSS